MTFDEILKYKKEIFNGRISEAVKIAIYDLHKTLYGYEFRKGCNSCYQDCFMKIYERLKPNQMSDYKLKPGALVLTSKDGSLAVTNASMTNEKAEMLINENKGLIKFFEKLPHDWEVRCGLKTVAPIVEEVIEEPIEEEIKEEIEEVIEEPVKKKRTKK